MVSSTQLSDKIRRLYAADPVDGERKISVFLEEVFSGGAFDTERKIEFLDAQLKHFKPGRGDLDANDWEDRELITRVLAGLLRKDVRPEDSSLDELLDRLSDSFETIFSQINNLVQIMTASLFGPEKDDATLRGMIASHLEGQDRLEALEAYILQIQDTFLASHAAFKAATLAVVKGVLAELSPENVAASLGKTGRVGPFRKAALYDRFEQKYDLCASWVRSERFFKDLTGELEKAFQASMTSQGGSL